MTIVGLTQMTVLELFCYYDNPAKFGFYLPNAVIKSLSEITSHFIELPYGRKYYSGTILQRPLNRIYFMDEFLHHEGVVIGTTNTNEGIIFEFNEKPERIGLRKVNLKGFLDTYDRRFLSIRYEPETPIQPSVLLARAQHWETYPYDVTECNCIDFAEWTVFGVRKFSFKEKQIEKCDDLVVYYKAVIDDTKQIALKGQYQEKLKSILERKERLQKDVESLASNHS